MTLTAGQLNRATLERQLLLRREKLGVVEGVHRVVALQAQEPPSPYLALWARLADFDPGELDAAFVAHAVVKATLLRVTMHAVDAADYPSFHEAMQVTLRAARLNDRRFRSTGLMPADADALVPDLVAFASEPRTNADVEAWLEERYGEPKDRIWWALRQQGPFVHAPTVGAWSFGTRPSYVAAPNQARPGDPVASMGRLIVRYLEGFGPASLNDFTKFGPIYKPDAREALEALGDQVVPLDGPGKGQLYDIPGGHIPDEDVPAPPRLLPMWDSALLAYEDRSRIIPTEYRKHVTRSNGDVLPTLLVDGHVAGVWRPTPGGGAIEATAFHRLTDDVWDALEAEARSLLTLLRSRDPRIYARYGRWWATLPHAGHVRQLGG